MTQNVQKSDTTASNLLFQNKKINDKIQMAAIALIWIPHETDNSNRLTDPKNQVSRHLTENKKDLLKLIKPKWLP